MIRSGKASLQHLAKQMDEPIDLESRVKKAKRWIMSKWTDTETHFVPYIVPILRSVSRSGQVRLAIDGSDIGKGCSALMISLIWRNRAIPLVWITRDAPKGHFSTEAHLGVVEQLVMLLDSILEQDCELILLGDGEFDSDQLQDKCKSNGWKYVLKTAKNIHIADNPDMEDYSTFKQMTPEVGHTTIWMPDVYVFQSGYGMVNALYYHDPKYKEPWYLLTNIDYMPKAVQLYRKRYCIETFFGDIKSRGFNIHKTRINDAARLFNLLMVAALAFIVAVLFEFQARRSRLLPMFCRKDRIDSYSVFQIGLQGLQFYIKSGIPTPFQFSMNFP